MKNIIIFVLLIISGYSYCQKTNKSEGIYSISGTYTVIAGPMWGYTDTIESGNATVISYNNQIVLLNFPGADSVMANVKRDSFYVITRTKEFENCTTQIDGSGKFAVDSIYYTSIVGGCFDGAIEYKCSGKKLTTNSKGKISSQYKLNCFPNPFRDFITIEYPSSEVTVLEILSAHGKLVFKRELTIDGSTKINLSLLPAGLYLVKLKTGNKMLTEKMLKN